MIHLDHADEADLLSLLGVGQASATRILTYLKVHGSFKTLQALVDCAPQLDIAQFRMQHDTGLWTSEIAELKKNTPPSAPDTQEKTNSPDGEGAGLETLSTNVPTITEDADLKTLLISFITETNNLNKQSAERLAKLEGGMTKVAEEMGQLRMEMRTEAVIGAHNAKFKGAPIMYGPKGPYNATGTTPKGAGTTPKGAGTTPNAAVTPPNAAGATSNVDRKPQLGDTIQQLKPAPPITSKVDNGYEAAKTDKSMAEMTTQRRVTFADTKLGQGAISKSNGSVSNIQRPGTETEDEYLDCEDSVESARSQPDEPRHTYPFAHQGNRYRQREDRSNERNNAPDTRNAKLVDKFDGKVGEWENWYHKFQLTATMCRWNDLDKLFNLTNALKGPALTAHRNLPTLTTLDYSAQVSAMKAKFGKTDFSTKAALRVELACIRQKEGEELETYADRVYSLTMDSHPVDMTLEQLQLYAVEAFLAGFTDKNAAWLTCNVKNPTSISDAVSQMKLAHSSSKRMGVKYAVRQITTTLSEDEQQADIDVRRMDNGESRCFRCGGRWHFARDCPNKQCDTCGGFGHERQVCPSVGKQLNKGPQWGRRNASPEQRNRSFGTNRDGRQNGRNRGPKDYNRSKYHQEVEKQHESTDDTELSGDSDGRKKSKHHKYSKNKRRSHEHKSTRRQSSQEQKSHRGRPEKSKSQNVREIQVVDSSESSSSEDLN